MTEPVAPAKDQTATKVAKGALWKVMLLAFLGMCANDLLGTAMVVFESHYDAALAGAMDVTGYFASLVCSVLALDSILADGWKSRRSLCIIGAVTVANFAGTYAGVYLSKGLLH